MDELTAKVMAKAGISEDEARKATKAVIDYLRCNLPRPAARQIDVLLQGNGRIDYVARNVDALLDRK